MILGKGTSNRATNVRKNKLPCTTSGGSEGFLCYDRECITDQPDYSYVCDGKEHCYYGEDERNCIKNGNDFMS